jgi:hypothetical protein
MLCFDLLCITAWELFKENVFVFCICLVWKYLTHSRGLGLQMPGYIHLLMGLAVSSESLLFSSVSACRYGNEHCIGLVIEKLCISRRYS